MSMDSHNISCSTTTPGHIVFLIDGGASMLTFYNGETTRISFVERCINEIIFDILRECLYGMRIRNIVYISVYQYTVDGVKLLFDSDIVTLYVKYKNEFYDWHKDKTPAFIKDFEVSSYGGGRLSETLSIVADYMELWKCEIKGSDRFIRSIRVDECIKYGEFREPLKAPLIINITKGFPTLDNEEDVLYEVEKIKSISFHDGSPLVFNVLIPLYDDRVCLNITADFVDSRWKLLWDISSDFPTYWKERWHINIEKGCLLNPRNSKEIFDLFVKPWMYPYRTSNPYSY